MSIQKNIYKNLNRKIGVMAGTPIDTKMGSDLLRKNNFDEIIEIPISKNPSEQTVFQTSSEENKEKIINFHIDEMKNQNCETLLVYCNSLSGAVDFEKLKKVKNINVITPMNIYSEIAKKYKKLGVISANAQGLSGIEKVMFQNNEEIEIVGFTLLEMVKEIEKGTKAEEIAKKFHFD